MAFKATEGPRLLPAYSVSEAAHYLRMPNETLRSWVVGRSYPASGQQRRSKPLIHLDDRKTQYLSFVNLVEARPRLRAAANAAGLCLRRTSGSGIVRWRSQPAGEQCPGIRTPAISVEFRSLRHS